MHCAKGASLRRYRAAWVRDHGIHTLCFPCRNTQAAPCNNIRRGRYTVSCHMESF